MESNQPLLTIFLVTYNHERYIHDTLNGIIMQKTKYPFIVKILEDCSTDNTLKICQKYVAKYPNIFTLIAQQQNTKGEHCRLALENEIQTPYWCMIEGDDYYTNPHFIEKAISFLESNSDYNAYCGNTIWKYPDREKLCVENCKQVGFDVSFYNYTYLHTSARVYRNIFNFKSYDRNIFDISWEINMYFLYLDKGKVYFENDVMSVYRYSGNGIWSSMSQYEIDRKNAKFYFTANNFFNDKYAAVFIRWLPKSIYKSIIKRIFGPKIGMRLLQFLYKYKGRVE